MAQAHRGFHLHHHTKDSATAGAAENMSGKTSTNRTIHAAETEAKEHKHRQHFAETCAVAAGAFALHEKHEAKKQPGQAHRHKMEEHIAGAIAVGAGAVAAHEKHQRKEAKKEAKHLRRHQH